MYQQFNSSRNTILYVHMIRQARRCNRRKGDGRYYEKHHILPKCMGGLNNKSNLILLTAMEHLRAHLLLPEMVNDKGVKYRLACAFHRMTQVSSTHKRSGVWQFYAVARRKFSELRTGIKHTDEARAKISAAHKGKVCPEETKTKISATLMGNKRTEETKAKISAALSGSKLKDDTKAKLSAANMGAKNPFSGKTHTAESRAKMSAARKRKKSPIPENLSK